jgi:hypothetical protein
MIKKGTLCYVVPDCRASPRAMGALGRIVEVVAGPFGSPPSADAGTYYDVRFRQRLFHCQADKLRPINDPDADVGAPLDGSHAG